MKEGIPSYERKLLGVLGSGENVYDRPRSHIHPSHDIETHLPIALSRINSNGAEFFIETISFGETIGENSCVATDETSSIVYAQRVGRRGYSRFVRNKEMTSTDELTVILKKIEDGYIVIAAFTGPKAEPEPWDANATEASIEFWNSHALVWGSQDVVPGTETEYLDESMRNSMILK